MAGLMDWDAYRQAASQQSANLNYMPFVDNPATMTTDPRQNSQMLYGKDVQDKSAQNTATDQAGLTKVVQDSFKAYFGRDANPQDLNAWVSGAMANGLDATALRAGIEAAAVKAGAGPGGTAGFASGMMGNNTFNGMAFGSGLMNG